MYNITFRSNTSSNSDSEINMHLAWSEQPTVYEITDKFFAFMKANGYVFDMYDKLAVINSGKSQQEEELINETPRQERKAKLSKVG